MDRHAVTGPRTLDDFPWGSLFIDVTAAGRGELGYQDKGYLVVATGFCLWWLDHSLGRRVQTA